MAFQSNTTESSYAGFLNGYSAGNLIANSGELSIHRERIGFFIDETKKELSKLRIPDESVAMFGSLSEAIHVLTPSDTVTFYYELGQKLLPIFTLFHELKTTHKTSIPNTADFLMRKAIYHYLNIADKAKDTTITSLAKQIVAQFEKK